ncbi:MAG: ROK family protein [Cyclobacteriaceae bacterium]|nr:ROK family protein [Cyclobacteriaceae bacterium]
MIIGVDLGGTNIRAGIESGGNLFTPRRDPFNTKQSKPETLNALKEFIRPLIKPEVKGIGIGVPSVVDVGKGIVFNATNIPSWDRVPLKDILEDEFRMPVVVNNDVNCFILGEHQFGLVKGLKNVVGISSGTGLGAGIVINNQLYNGSNCGAGEIGLLHYLDHNIEYYASGNLFQVRHNTTAAAAHKLALEGDTAALGYWDEFGVHMAQAVKSAVLAYDPEAIVLGGSLSKAFNLFSRSMHDSLQDFPFPESIKRLKICQSQNPDITLLGAAALVKI